MKVIVVRNVAEALPVGLSYLLAHGEWEETRAGRAIVAPEPVTTVYERPRERVLFSAIRDANPFFHLMEALYMLAGRRDTAFLNNFVLDFGTRFAEPDGTIHDGYGYRWRHAFGFDQLDAVVQQLSEQPGSRQAVIQMWDCTLEASREIDKGPSKDIPGGRVVEIEGVGMEDLTGEWRTRPCNTHVYLRMRDDVLDITVCCRSNDIIMGAYGANAVQFSVLQEYLAARLDVGVGKYYQVSNNYHAYETDIERLSRRAPKLVFQWQLPMSLVRNDYFNGDIHPFPLVHDVDSFDEELKVILRYYEIGGTVLGGIHNRFLSHSVWPMLMAHRDRKLSTWRNWAFNIEATDWRIAAVEWLERRANPKGETK